MTITFRTGITLLDIVFGALALLLIYRLITRSNPIPEGLYYPSFPSRLSPYTYCIEGLKLPPGPPGKLIFGNAGDMPTRLEWKTFSQWAKDYGKSILVTQRKNRFLFHEEHDIKSSGDDVKRVPWASQLSWTHIP